MKKASLSKGCSQIPLTAHGLSHILFDKPQSDEYDSPKCLVHTTYPRIWLSFNWGSFLVTSLSLKSNARGTCRISFISRLSFLTHWSEQNGAGQLAVTTFQDCFQASRGAESYSSTLEMLGLLSVESVENKDNNPILGPQNHRMSWVGRDIKYDLVPTPLLLAGTSFARSGCSELHLTWPWTLRRMWHPHLRATCSSASRLS